MYNMKKWLIFSSQFMVMFFLSGSIKIGGVLFQSVVSKGFSATTTGFMFIIPYSVGRLYGPITGVLLPLYGYRIVGTMGGFLVGAGYVLTGLLAAESAAIHIIFSITSGIGFGCLILPTTMCMKDHFDDEFPSIKPIAMLGSYVGVAVIPPIMEFFLQTYGADATFIIFGAFCWNLIPCGLLLSPILTPVELEEELHPGTDTKDINSWNSRKSSSNSNTLHYSTRETIVQTFLENILLFTDFGFLIYLLVSNLRNFPSHGWLLYLIPHTEQLGFTSHQASQIASVGGLGGILGRLVASISFKIGISPFAIYLLLFVLNGIVFIAMESVGIFRCSSIMQYVASVLNGIFLSAQSAMTFGILTLIVHDTYFKTACGLMDFGNGVISIVAGITPGYFLEHLGNLDLCYYIFGVISLFNGFLVAILWIRKPYFSPQE